MRSGLCCLYEIETLEAHKVTSFNVSYEVGTKPKHSLNKSKRPKSSFVYTEGRFEISQL